MSEAKIEAIRARQRTDSFCSQIKNLTCVMRGEARHAAAEIAKEADADIATILARLDAVEADLDSAVAEEARLRESGSKLYKAIKRGLGYKNWPEIEGDVHEWIRQKVESELTRLRSENDADVAERDLPIDEAFATSIAIRHCDLRNFWWVHERELASNVYLRLNRPDGTFSLWIGSEVISRRATRGQLLDLLSALGVTPQGN